MQWAWFTKHTNNNRRQEIKYKILALSGNCKHPPVYILVRISNSFVTFCLRYNQLLFGFSKSHTAPRRTSPPPRYWGPWPRVWLDLSQAWKETWEATGRRSENELQQLWCGQQLGRVYFKVSEEQRSKRTFDKQQSDEKRCRWNTHEINESRIVAMLKFLHRNDLP